MLKRIKDIICEVKDFPKPGIGFKDITPLVEDAECFRYVIDRITGWAEGKGIEIVAGIESRGFLFSAPVSYQLGLGSVLIRKKGKLPRKTVSVKAPNEYAVEYFEINEDSIQKGQKVIIIDDLIATGSSTISAIDLVKILGGEVVGFAAVVELCFLGGRDNIKKAHPEVDVFSLIKYED